MKELADPVNSAIVKMDEALAQDRKEEVELFTKWRSEVQASVGDVSCIRSSCLIGRCLDRRILSRHTCILINVTL